MEQRKPILKIKIIAISSIQHPTMECGAAGTCDDMTSNEDAVLLSDYVGYPGIPIKLTHKGGDTEIKTRYTRMHRKTRTVDKCINMLATRISNSQDADWASIFVDTYGLLA